MPHSAEYLAAAAVNRMHASSSPYLLQHATNPVHWQPWGDAAFDVASARDVPVLLSVGYAACHWCHVMAHESFEDAAVAALMNANYVCIKVDREERPDIDAVYMAATQALCQGRGGWPMTVLLTPDKKPFFAGTYFPPTAKHGLPGFAELLQHMADLWRDDRPRVLEHAGDVAQALARPEPEQPGDLPAAAATQSLIETAAQTLAQRYDARAGGFTQAPKFPHTETLRLGLACRAQASALAQGVRHTLTCMSQGGLFDLVGGGFSRYSVDAAWHVPHFEKMLYDNALLATTYAEAAMVWPEASFAQVARRTADFVVRELAAPDGRFYASLDADSEGHEGLFYVWTHAQAQAVLSPHLPPADVVNALASLQITEVGNWEGGLNIPRLSEPEADGKAIDAALVDAACTHLLRARANRVRPATDTKILTGHNGMMATALATLSRIDADGGYLEAGCRAVDAVWAQAHLGDGTLLRTGSVGNNPIAGLLEDYAYFAEGMLALYEAGGPWHLVQRCQLLCSRILKEFAAPQSGVLFDTPHHHEALLFRPRESHDGATPSAAATAAHTLLRLAVHLGDATYAAAGKAALAAMAADIRAMPHAHCRSLLALDFHHAPAQQGVWVTQDNAHRPDALHAALVAAFAPHRVLAHGSLAQADAAAPLLAHRKVYGPVSCVYLCENYMCTAPISEVEALQRALRGPNVSAAQAPARQP